jgi:hypothetical protein
MLDGPKVERCTRWCFLLILLSISAVGGAQDQGTLCGTLRLCVYTYGDDQSRDNVNPNETVLKASTLQSLTPTSSPDLKGIVSAAVHVERNDQRNAGECGLRRDRGELGLRPRQRNAKRLLVH